MRRFLEKIQRRMWQGAGDDRGLTLVELICAVAIFGTLTAAIGGVMVVSANSFQRGTNEIELQQEAQFTVNQISDLVVDATAKVSWSDPILTINRDKSRYVITYDAARSEILYSEYEKTVDSEIAIDENQLLAENVVDFDATIEESGDVRVFLKLNRNGKEYESWYTISPRNGVMGGSDTLAASIVTETELTLEPNEDFVMDIDVVGNISDKSLTAGEVLGRTDTDTQVLYNPTEGKWHIKIGRDEMSPQMSFDMRTVATDPETSIAYASTTILVNIRRVNVVNVNGWLYSGTAADLKANAVYKVTASSTGTNLNRVLAVEYDNETNYKNPYFVKWNDPVMTIDGVSAVWSDYVEFIERKEDENSPYVLFKLKQDMPPKSKIVFTATVKHPEGNLDGTQTNKSNMKYDTVEEEWPLENPDAGVITLDGELKRGEERTFSSSLNPESLRDYSKDPSGGVHGTFFWFCRIRVKNEDGSYEEWTPYAKTQEGGTVKKLGDAESRMFAPDKEYELEIMGAVVGNEGGVNKLYWPHDESLLNDATNGFAGYVKGWADGDFINTKDEYASTFDIKKVQIAFEGNPLYGVPDGAVSFGTESNPIKIKPGDYLEIKFPTVTAVSSVFDNGYGVVIQKLNPDTGIWETSDKGKFNTLQTGSKLVRVSVDQNTTVPQSEYYRLGIVLKDARFNNREGTLLEPNFNSYTQDFNLYDFDEGYGTIYLELCPKN